MVVSKVGKNEILSLISPHITSDKMGDDSTPPTAGNTDLISEIVGSEKTPTVIVSDKQVTTSSEWNAADNNGETFRESAIYVNGVLLDRVVFPDFIKTANNFLTKRQSMRFK